MEFKHKPVLLNECIEGLNIKPDGIYVDGTLGGAGHSEHIVKKLSNAGKLIGIDRDTDALNAAKERLKEYSNVLYIHGNHDNIKDILKELEIEKNIIEILRRFIPANEIEKKTYEETLEFLEYVERMLE